MTTIRDAREAQGEALLRYVIAEHLRAPRQEIAEALLLEVTVDSNTAKDVLQFALAAAVEYGIDVPTLGAGAPFAAAGETVIDSMFAADAISTAVENMKNAKSIAGEYAGLFRDAIAAYDPSNWDGYYKALKALVQRLLADLGGAKEKVDEVISEIKEIIQRMVDSLVQPIKKSIQVIVPDAVAGVAVAQAIESALKSLAENAYDVVTTSIDKVKFLKDFVKDPSSAVDFFDDLITKLIALIRDAADNIENPEDAKGSGENGSTTSTAGGVLLKVIKAASPAVQVADMVKKGVGPKLLRQVADSLEDFAPKFLDLLGKILEVIVPYAITCLALFQILATGDYETEKEVLAAGRIHSGAVMNEKKFSISRNALRRMIAEELQLVTSRKLQPQ